MITDQQKSKISFQFITNRNELGDDAFWAYAAVTGGCRWIQLRLKDGTPKEMFRTCVKVRSHCRPTKAVFIVNDNAEFALDNNADGVHLGKNDMPLEYAVKEFGKKLIVGATCNTFEDVEYAYEKGADYVGLGPMRFTPTKENLSPELGIEGYFRIIMQCEEKNIRIPIIALGGLTENDINPLVVCGVDGVAISSRITKEKHPYKIVKKISNLINQSFYERENENKMEYRRKFI